MSFLFCLVGPECALIFGCRSIASLPLLYNDSKVDDWATRWGAGCVATLANASPAKSGERRSRPAGRGSSARRLSPYRRQVQSNGSSIRQGALDARPGSEVGEERNVLDDRPQGNQEDLRRGSPELPCLALMLQCRGAQEEDLHEPRNAGA